MKSGSVYCSRHNGNQVIWFLALLASGAPMMSFWCDAGHYCNLTRPGLPTIHKALKPARRATA